LSLRGAGRWKDALALVSDPLARADVLPGVAAGLFTLGEVAAEQGRPGEGRELLSEEELAQEVGAEPFLRLIDRSLASLG
jgi:hypothetical protein